VDAFFSIVIPAKAGKGKKTLSRLREREGAHPEGMGRVRDHLLSGLSLTLPLLRNGPLPLPLAGEGLIAIGPSAKMYESTSALAGVTIGALKTIESSRVSL